MRHTSSHTSSSCIWGRPVPSRDCPLFLSKALLSSGVTLSFDAGEFGGGHWSLPPGAAEPDRFSPITGGRLELIEAGTAPDAAISARFCGYIGGGTALSSAETEAAVALDTGLAINAMAAQGEPRDWLELYNASDSHLALANFVLANNLTDASQRVPFPSGLVLPSGAYLQVALDKDGWPGFALGRDEELGIWTIEGILVDSVDWNEGQADAGTSFARVPDGAGDFQTVSNSTPGARNWLPAMQCGLRSSDPAGAAVPDPRIRDCVACVCCRRGRGAPGLGLPWASHDILFQPHGNPGIAQGLFHPRRRLSASRSRVHHVHRGASLPRWAWRGMASLPGNIREMKKINSCLIAYTKAAAVVSARRNCV